MRQRKLNDHSGVLFLDRKDCECCWPIGDWQCAIDARVVCGRPVSPTHPSYCHEHAVRATTKVAPRVSLPDVYNIRVKRRTKYEDWETARREAKRARRRERRARRRELEQADS